MQIKDVSPGFPGLFLKTGIPNPVCRIFTNSPINISLRIKCLVIFFCTRLLRRKTLLCPGPTLSLVKGAIGVPRQCNPVQTKLPAALSSGRYLYRIIRCTPTIRAPMMQFPVKSIYNLSIFDILIRFFSSLPISKPSLLKYEVCVVSDMNYDRYSECLDRLVRGYLVLGMSYLL